MSCLQGLAAVVSIPFGCATRSMLAATSKSARLTAGLCLLLGIHTGLATHFCDCEAMQRSSRTSSFRA